MTYSLTAKKRDLIGKKVKKLRRAGQIPGTVYGKKIATLPLVFDTKEFKEVFIKAEKTNIVNLTIEGDKTKYSVLIHDVSRHPIDRYIENVGLLAIDLNETLRVVVPVSAVGESPAVRGNIGILISPVHELEVECLPVDLPEDIKIDISKLTELGQEIRLKDVDIPQKVKVLADPETLLFKIDELVQKEKNEEEVTPHEAEAVKEKKEEESEAREVPADKDKKEEK